MYSKKIDAMLADMNPPSSLWSLSDRGQGRGRVRLSARTLELPEHGSGVCMRDPPILSVDGTHCRRKAVLSGVVDCAFASLEDPKSVQCPNVSGVQTSQLLHAEDCIGINQRARTHTRTHL